MSPSFQISKVCSPYLDTCSLMNLVVAQGQRDILGNLRIWDNLIKGKERKTEREREKRLEERKRERRRHREKRDRERKEGETERKKRKIERRRERERDVRRAYSRRAAPCDVAVTPGPVIISDDTICKTRGNGIEVNERRRGMTQV